MDIQVEDVLEAILQEEVQRSLEEEQAILHAVAQVGGRLMGILEDGIDSDDDANNWEGVEVDIEGYRRMSVPSFRRHFRLTKPCFEIVLQIVGNHLVIKGRIQRIRTPLGIVMMVLWILANPDTFRSVALRFGCQPGTVHFHYCYTIEALREMAPQFIRWPNQAERATSKAAFERYSGFPGIVGCIDGTLNPIVAPSRQKLWYRDRHHQYSRNTLVVCDHRLLVTSVYIGEVGSMHDQRVLRRSPLFRKLINAADNFMLPDEHLVGDGGYTLLDKLLIQFRNVGNLTEAEIRYNRRLCKCRSRIEHAHGKTFGQWRRLRYLHTVNLELGADHIMACYVLHNIMILNGEEMLDLGDHNVCLDDDDVDEEEDGDDEDADEEHMDDNELNQKVRQSRELGVEKRWHIVYTLQ